MMRGRANTLTRRGLMAVAMACGLGLATGSGAGPALAADPRLDVHPASGNPSEAAASLVQDLGDKTANALSSPAAEEPAQRRKLLRHLVRQGFDLALTSQFVLGKYWNRASEAQRSEFVDLFTEYLLNSYARHLASFRADTLSVVGSHPVGEKDILVETSVSGSDGPVTPVWRVRAVDGLYKIIDVTVDGVSLALTQRREFASVVNRVGLDGLLQMLREKLATQAKTTGLRTRQASHASLLGSILASPNANRLDIFIAGK